METLTVDRVIAAPSGEVFDWISNSHNYTRTPLVVHEHLARHGTATPYGEGAVRVLGWMVGWFWERVTAYDRPNSFDYHVYRSFPPSRHDHGRVTCTSVGDGTRVEWSTTFELSIPLLGGFLTRRLGVPIMRHAFGRVLALAAADLER
jgi:hypothetical protein